MNVHNCFILRVQDLLIKLVITARIELEVELALLTFSVFNTGRKGVVANLYDHNYSLGYVYERDKSTALDT